MGFLYADYYMGNYDLGFDPLSAGAAVGGIIGSIKNIFGGAPATKMCVDVCTGAPLGKIEKKAGGCDEVLGPYATNQPDYTAKKLPGDFAGNIPVAGLSWEQYVQKVCSAGSNATNQGNYTTTPPVGAPPGTTPAGIPQEILLIGGGLLLLMMLRK